MGLFGKLFEKKECSVCSGEIGLLGNRKLEDGNLCKDCARKLSPWFDERRHSTVEQIKQQLSYRQENEQEVERFYTTRSFRGEYLLSIDDNQRKFMVSRTSDVRKENPDVVSLSQVTGCDLDVKEHRYEEKTRNEEGKEVSFNPPRYRYTYDFYLVIRVNHPYFDDMRFRLNDRTIEVFPPSSRGGFFDFSTESPGRRSYEYQQYENMGREIRDVLLGRGRSFAQEKHYAGDHTPAGGDTCGRAFRSGQNMHEISDGREEVPGYRTGKTTAICPWCNSPVPAGTKFCENCGGKIEVE